MSIQPVLGLLLMSMFGIVVFQNCSKVGVTDLQSKEAEPTNIIQIAPNPICQKVDSPDAQPTLLYAWDHASSLEPDFKQVMAAPVVGDIDGDKIPEILFTSYQGERYRSQGVLRVLDGRDGSLKFSVASDDLRPLAATTPLIIDIDGNGKGEIIYGHYSSRKIIALNSDGSQRWVLVLPEALGTCSQGFAAADLNGDGIAEIIAGGYIIQEDKMRIPHILTTFADSACSSYAASLDLERNSPLRIIGDAGVYDTSGVPIWTFINKGQAATADLIPEIPGIEVVVTGNGNMAIYSSRGDVILNKSLFEHSELICPGNVIGGGQATIGDFDGDPTNLEIAVATGRSLTIFNKKGEIIAGSVTQDCSSKFTGITSFDFNGDGKPEIIYGDEQYLRIFEMDGSRELKVIWSTINPSGTWHEYPVVADVDGSGEAKLVVVANNMWARSSSIYTTEQEKNIAEKITGLRVFGPKVKNAWMPTRSVWNQYAYFVSNVQDNLRATATTILNGFAGNAFKRNVQKGMFQGACVQQ